MTCQKEDQLACSRYCQILSDSTAVCCPTFTATSLLQSESFLHKSYWHYQRHLKSLCQLKSCPFEGRILKCNLFNNNCIHKEGLLACENFDFLTKWLYTGRNSLQQYGDRSQQVSCASRTYLISSL